MDAGQVLGLAVAAGLIIPTRWLARQRRSLLIARYVCIFAGIALLLALAVGSPSAARFWIVLGVTGVVLLPYVAALTWLVGGGRK